nr:type II CRISPR RNA-guided endonuclease Cas9 [uncultured Porphyromonas sp.]
MKKVLGLDLGVGSIGWSLIALDEDQRPAEILGMGCRIVPLTTEESKFASGEGISKNAERTQMRTMRKMLDRYQQRRTKLANILREHQMYPDEALMQLPLMQLWQLRADAATPGHQLSLPELGRVLYHLSQKRGYRHSKSDESGEKKDTEYVAEVKSRYQQIQEEGLTVGQHFAKLLKDTEQRSERGGVYYNYRTKDQVFPREAYAEEFDRIMAVQRGFHPSLTDRLIAKLRDCIFYQRPLKSCKHLVSYCEFERKQVELPVKQVERDGTITYKKQLVDVGPKVAPKSSPLAEVCRIWETLNNLRLYFPDGSERTITQEERQRLFDYLQENDALSLAQTKKLLKCKDEDLFSNILIEKKKKEKPTEKKKKGGNEEDLSLSALPEEEQAKMEAETAKDKEEKGNPEVKIKGNTTTAILRKALKGYKPYLELLSFELTQEEKADPETGELRPVISECYQQEPLYKLWHILYSIEDKEAMRRALTKQIGISEADLEAGLLDQLFKVDFVKQGYANKSIKFISKLLPHLMQGYMYSEAAERAGKRHSESLTLNELQTRPLLDKIPVLQRNSLRQPVVEKILNQMINLVNQLKEDYGEIDEVRVELARELKMSREERERTAKNQRKNEKENKRIAGLIKELGLSPTRARIQKYKLWEESQECCMYCGKMMNLTQFLSGSEVEVEHIIPRSILYDDSLSNKTCACRMCNQEKGNRTAKEYILSKDEATQKDYNARVQELFELHKISASKRSRLHMTLADIPEDFLERHLRLTQYISREAQSILAKGIRYVRASEGTVTATLRRLWGYDEILKRLNFEIYKSRGETETVSVGGVATERLANWSKRNDHRHHALDALVVACTRQGYIQRLNRLNTEVDKESMRDELPAHEEQRGERLQLLERWLIAQPHFAPHIVQGKVAEILVSLHPGGKTYSKGRNIIKRKGQRFVQEGILVPRGALSAETVYGSIQQGDHREIVCKYALHAITGKDTPHIVDQRLRSIIAQRLAEHGGDPKKAFAEPLYSDRAKTQQVRSVRCFTGLLKEKLAPLHRDAEGQVTAFVSPSNNHHVALYRDAAGQLQECISSFWQVIERVRFGLPPVIYDPRATMAQALSIAELPEAVLRVLPHSDWRLEMTLRQNEFFLIRMSDEEIASALETQNYSLLSRHLYRVQKLSSMHYVFRHHLETSVKDDKNTSGEVPKFYRVQSLKTYSNLNPRKVKVDRLGKISLL